MAFLPGALARPLVLLSLLATVPVVAQTARREAPRAAPVTAAMPAGVDTSPWLFRGSDIPPDPAWHFGTLPNGLRYAVRRNGVPPGQVAVRVRIDAGSLYEQDAERGYAHLVEHLSFRGSKHVPDGEAKRVWQRFGATFGSDSNASTTPTQTVYKLDLPGATEASVDESLKIFAGMMSAPAITQANLDAERPAVLAEQREQPGPQVRFGDAMRAIFFAGQPLADRATIGTIKELEAATPETVSAFHRRWYRPERAVVILSGDIDPATAARLIVRNFGDWRGTGPNPADPDFGKPDPAAPTTATIAEPSIPPIVAMATLRPWRYQDDTIEFNQRRYIDFLAARIISRRLERRAQAGGSFLQASVSLDDVSRSANGTFVNIIPIGDDWAAALKDVRAVIADALATAPSQAEIDRELAEFEAAVRNDVDTARVEAGTKQADDMVQALDIRETVAGPATSYDILKGARDKGFFTPANLLASTRKIFSGDATRAMVNTRTADPGATAKLAAALKADVSGIDVRRAEQAQVDFSRLPALGAPATVTSRTTVPGLAMETITFSNGVRLLLFANTGETGRVYVRTRFGGGYSALPGTRTTPAWAGELALWPSGVGDLRQGDMEALTTGRRIAMSLDIGDDAFQFSAMTTPNDYRDQLRLMATKLAAPNWDPTPIARAKAAFAAGYAGYESSPTGILSRDLEGLLRSGDARWTMPLPKTAERLTPKAFRDFWAPLLASGPIEVAVFGDVKAEEAITAVAATLGALKPRTTTPVAPATVRFPAHNTTPVVRTHSGPDNQAAALIAWPTGGGSADIAESRRLDILASVFGDRLFERLRSVAGASYSPSAQSQWPIGLASGGRIVALGQVAPDKVDLFFQLSREIAADLVANPLSDDELRRTLAPMGQLISRAATGNQFWMNLTQGGTYDPNRLEAARSVLRDYVTITPQSLQETAARYLKPERDWTLVVLPKAVAAAQARGRAGAAQAR